MLSALGQDVQYVLEPVAALMANDPKTRKALTTAVERHLRLSTLLVEHKSMRAARAAAKEAPAVVKSLLK